MVTLLHIAIAALLVQGEPAIAEENTSIGDQIARAAVERTNHHVVYDARYRALTYPGGDVPPDRGVCADLVVRSLRVVGLDLQRAIHEDMTRAFDDYPTHWGLSAPDTNIDHRRVPNIARYLTRIGAALPPSSDREDYEPGDIIAWNLRGTNGYLAHIGVVTHKRARSGRYLIAHNIGAGPKLEDVMFAWPITGRYRLVASTLSAAE